MQGSRFKKIISIFAFKTFINQRVILIEKLNIKYEFKRFLKNYIKLCTCFLRNALESGNLFIKKHSIKSKKIFTFAKEILKSTQKCDIIFP